MSRAEEYDVKKVTCTINGKIMTGYAADGVVTVASSEDAIIPNVGAQGDTAYSINANESGTATFTFQSTSSSLKYLYGLYAAKTPIDVVINDANNSTGFIMRGEDGRITKMPDRGRLKEMSTVSVPVFVPRIEFR